MPERKLEKRRILVVEDEYYLAEELKEELTNAGALVVGPASTIQHALALLDLQSSLDGAVLDVNLRGQSVFALADMLIDRSVPLIFTTGYDPSVLAERFSDILVCEKPVNMAQIMAAIYKAIQA